MSEKTARQPALFVGHGSPMNALADNAWTRALSALGERLERPRAVLCVSAHWLTRGDRVAGAERPRTIHDFAGFPEALYREEYPARGCPALAARVREALGPDCGVDAQRGFDHGAWTALKFLYPKADVPVVQLSVDAGGSARRRLEVGARLRALREEGVLIVGSGNVVHNLSRVDFSDRARPLDWALEFEAWVKERLRARDFDALAGDVGAAPSGRLAVPTTDHYDPMLYVLGAADETEVPRIEHEGVQNGSISMLSFSLGGALGAKITPAAGRNW